MARLISITDELYSQLTKIKHNGSYSDVIRSLLATKCNKEQLLSCFGRGGIDKDKIDQLRPQWKKWSERYASTRTS